MTSSPTMLLLLLLCLSATQVGSELVLRLDFESVLGGRTPDTSGAPLYGDGVLRSFKASPLSTDARINTRSLSFASTLGSHLDFDVTLAPPSAHTRAGWVKPSATSPVPMSVMAFGLALGAGGGAVAVSDFRLANGRVSVHLSEGPTVDDTVSDVITGTARVDDGGWHHIALTALTNAAGTATSFALYVDGVLDIGPVQSTIVPSVDTLTVGKRTMGVADNPLYYNGLIDDLRLYDAILSAPEIASLAQLPPQPTTTVTTATSTSSTSTTTSTTSTSTRTTTTTSTTATTSTSTATTATAMDPSVYQLTPGVHLDFELERGVIALDSSGNGHHGNLVNFGANTERSDDRKVGFRSLMFQAGAGQFLQLPFFSLLLPDLTFAAWVRLSAGVFPPTRTVIALGSAAGTGNTVLELRVSNSIAQGRVLFHGAQTLASASFALQRDVWHHVALVVQPAEPGIVSLQVYVDGFASGAAARATASLTPTDLTVGKQDDGQPGSAKTFFAGLLDDVRVYNVALTPTQVLELVQTASTLQTTSATTVSTTTTATTTSTTTSSTTTTTTTATTTSPTTTTATTAMPSRQPFAVWALETARGTEAFDTSRRSPSLNIDFEPAAPGVNPWTNNAREGLYAIFMPSLAAGLVTSLMRDYPPSETRMLWVRTVDEEGPLLSYTQRDPGTGRRQRRSNQLETAGVNVSSKAPGAHAGVQATLGSVRQPRAQNHPQNQYQNQTPHHQQRRADDAVSVYEIGLFDGFVRARIVAGAEEHSVSSFRTVNDGEWHHVALVSVEVPGDKRLAELFVDGLSQGVASPFPFQPTALDQVSIGYLGANAGGPTTLVGAVDDVRLYDVALTQEEIQTVILNTPDFTTPTTTITTTTSATTTTTTTTSTTSSTSTSSTTTTTTTTTTTATTTTTTTTTTSTTSTTTRTTTTTTTTSTTSTTSTSTTSTTTTTTSTSTSTTTTTTSTTTSTTTTTTTTTARRNTATTTKRNTARRNMTTTAKRAGATRWPVCFQSFSTAPTAPTALLTKSSLKKLACRFSLASPRAIATSLFPTTRNALSTACLKSLLRVRPSTKRDLKTCFPLSVSRVKWKTHTQDMATVVVVPSSFLPAAAAPFLLNATPCLNCLQFLGWCRH
eukprot:m.178633 g.178633  ORF g.178633 m.178633 type:complete len:1130 (+) comp17984_c1_seq2:323-3712(+)